ncbi:hypothetical protein ABT337_30010, partial [Saccharopolyspora hirsuta]
MTDPIGEPEPIKGDDHSRATFDQVLFTVTGEGANLNGVLDSGAEPNQGWFVESAAKAGSEKTDGQTAATGYSYHAWDKWYISVDRNTTLPNNWTKAIGEIDALTDALQAANLGLMNVNRLREAKESVDHYVQWLATNRDALQQWVNKLNSDDSAFKGKAAYALKQNVTSLMETVESLHEQIAEERNTSEGLQKAAEAASNFGRGMASAWSEYSSGLKSLVNNTMNAVLNNVYTYVRGKGLLHGTPNYALDVLAMRGREKAEEYITSVISGYRSDDGQGPGVDPRAAGLRPEQLVWVLPGTEVEMNGSTFTPSPLPDGFPVLSGPLNSQATWNDINAKISNYVREQLKPLDEAARKQLEDLQTGYERTKPALEGLETPTPQTTGGSGGSTSNFPPLGGGDLNIPPPNGGGDLNVPPPNGGGDLNVPPPNGGGDLNVPPPNGAGDLPPANGGGLPPGGGQLPGGGEVPALGGGGHPSGGSGEQPPGGQFGLGGDVPPANGGGAMPFLPPPVGGSANPNGSGSSPESRRLLNGMPGGDPFNPANGGSDLQPPPGGGANLPGGSFDPAGGAANLPGGPGDSAGGGLPDLSGASFDPAGGTSTLPGGADLPGG